MNARQGGMTLIEVTVATVIFSMVMLATVTAFRTFAGTYSRLEQETSRTTQMRETERFLRATLKSALNSPAPFEGKPRMVRWVAPLDRVGGVVGLQQLRLAQRDEQLLLSFAPLTESDRPIQWSKVVLPFPLINDLEKIRFFYQLSAGGDWSEQSSLSRDASGAGEGLPRAIAIEIVAGGRSWPPVIVQFDQYRPTL